MFTTPLIEFKFWRLRLCSCKSTDAKLTANEMKTSRLGCVYVCVCVVCVCVRACVFVSVRPTVPVCRGVRMYACARH